MKESYREEMMKEALRPDRSADEALNQKIIAYEKEKEEKGAFYRRRMMQSGMRRFAMAAAAFCAVLLLGSGVYAATQYFGLEFFASQMDEAGLSGDVKKMIEEKPEVTVKKSKYSKGILNYEVSEVLCDSRYLVTTVDISVKEPDKYFVFSGTVDINEPMELLDIGIKSKDTIGTYCKKHGLKPVQAHFEFDKKTKKLLERSFGDAKQTDSGKVTCMFGARRLTKDKEFIMGLEPDVVHYDGEEYVTHYVDDIQQVHVKDKSEEKISFYQVESPEAYQTAEGNRIQIERVELKSTEVGSYLEVEYTLGKKISEDDGDGYVILEACDENGKVLEFNSLTAEGSCSWLGQNRYLSQENYQNIGSPKVLHLLVDGGKEKRVITLKRVDS